MKARIAQRTNTDRPRVKLEDFIPLEAPFVIMVDPSSACNLRCKFCPTGDLQLIKSTGRYQGYMTLPMFKKIICDLDEFVSPIKTLRLYKEGEPLVNPKFPEFVEIAKKSNKIGRIDTTTNGILLKPDLSKRIIESGIDQINISINGVSKDQYKFLTKSKIDFEKLVDNIAYLHSISGDCEIYIKAIEENLSDEEKDIFFNIFGEISDRIYLEHLQPNWPNFSFNYSDVNYTVGHYGQPLDEKNVCPYIFYILVINADGSVSACVQDWPHYLKIGDLNKESVRSVWNGLRLKDIQIKHLQGKRCDIQMCSVCPVMKHGLLDDIDSSADLLLSKILKGDK